ncbi:hypothetical protein B0681_07125 [Moraxella porci DSM 25326]|uniref:Uncharacterized protein n=1 Tax=Moraxella porci DSM 25326 TaxID=573983 RepID=A0A1T0CQ25_9GAMM|nr:hypothetical protein [Moraxella porci]OOS24452.1 hypothetical protein B0681_07125 [Moraxella porci DSM 25326]
MKVTLTPLFAKHLQNFPKADRQKILAFINHVEQFGLNNLAGRNKSSDNAPTNHPSWLNYVNYAKMHRLWHYHIGIPDYQGELGDLTSEYILHYIRNEDEIILVDLSSHPPFALPLPHYLPIQEDL